VVAIGMAVALPRYDPSAGTYTNADERLVFSAAVVAGFLASLTVGIAAAVGASTQRRHWIASALYSFVTVVVMLCVISASAVVIYLSPVAKGKMMLCTCCRLLPSSRL
jgi:hypothetical protein